ncbi:MAG: type II toxin-antitoxin system HicA family toxin [Clostridia bacterium]|nr:MAG: type II toxin-antitoxin system HicA family toxin [Clostridia bacterium]
MTRLPRVGGKEVVAALKSAGFVVVNVEGSHHQLYRRGSGLVTVPVHPKETLPPKTLKSILKQAGLTIDQLLDLL